LIIHTQPMHCSSCCEVRDLTWRCDDCRLRMCSQECTQAHQCGKINGQMGHDSAVNIDTEMAEIGAKMDLFADKVYRAFRIMFMYMGGYVLNDKIEDTQRPAAVSRLLLQVEARVMDDSGDRYVTAALVKATAAINSTREVARGDLLAAAKLAINNWAEAYGDPSLVKRAGQLAKKAANKLGNLFRKAENKKQGPVYTSPVIIKEHARKLGDLLLRIATGEAVPEQEIESAARLLGESMFAEGDAKAAALVTKLQGQVQSLREILASITSVEELIRSVVSNKTAKIGNPLLAIKVAKALGPTVLRRGAVLGRKAAKGLQKYGQSGQLRSDVDQYLSQSVKSRADLLGVGDRGPPLSKYKF